MNITFKYLGLSPGPGPLFQIQGFEIDLDMETGPIPRAMSDPCSSLP